jgi:hypothetical protein
VDVRKSLAVVEVEVSTLKLNDSLVLIESIRNNIFIILRRRPGNIHLGSGVGGTVNGVVGSGGSDRQSVTLNNLSVIYSNIGSVSGKKSKSAQNGWIELDLVINSVNHGERGRSALSVSGVLIRNSSSNIGTSSDIEIRSSDQKVRIISSNDFDTILRIISSLGSVSLDNGVSKIGSSDVFLGPTDVGSVGNSGESVISKSSGNSVVDDTDNVVSVVFTDVDVFIGENGQVAHGEDEVDPVGALEISLESSDVDFAGVLVDFVVLVKEVESDGSACDSRCFGLWIAGDDRFGEVKAALSERNLVDGWSSDSSGENKVLLVGENAVHDLEVQILDCQELVETQSTNADISVSSDVITSISSLSIGVTSVVGNQIRSRSFLSWSGFLSDEKSHSVLDSESITLTGDFGVGNLFLLIIVGDDDDISWISSGIVFGDTSDEKLASVLVVGDIMADDSWLVKIDDVVSSEIFSLSLEDLHDDFIVIEAHNQSVLGNLLNPVEFLVVLVLEELGDVRHGLVVDLGVVSGGDKWIGNITQIVDGVEVLVVVISCQEGFGGERVCDSNGAVAACDKQQCHDCDQTFHLD